MNRKNKFVALILLLLLISSLEYPASSSMQNTKPGEPFFLPYFSLPGNAVLDSTDKTEDMLIAILGSDERGNEKSRSDVLMLTRYRSSDNSVAIISIPRDSRVPIPGRGMGKINSAYAFGGAKLQVEILEKLFRITNISYIHFNFEGFVKVIDALGGLKINAEKDFRRDWGDMGTYAVKGENILLGEDLLEYVRFRHDSEGDFGRIKRQQEVLSSLYSSVLSTRKASKLAEIFLLIAKNSDSDMNIFTIMKRMESIGDPNLLKLEFRTLKTHSRKVDGIWYEIIDSEDLNHISELLQ